MRVIALAGGKGKWLDAGQNQHAKVLARIGDRPLLWHLMSHFSVHGLREFSIALGPIGPGDCGDEIKQYIAGLSLTERAMRIETKTGLSQSLENSEPTWGPNWSVDLIETGSKTKSAGRLRQLSRFLPRETFLLTFCDGLSDFDPHELIRAHRESGRLVTMMTIPRSDQSKYVVVDGDRVTKFSEKPPASEGRVSAGVFAVEFDAIDLIDNNEMDWDVDLLPRLAAGEQLAAHHHDGFWQFMDSHDDQQRLTELITSGETPWKVL